MCVARSVSSEGTTKQIEMKWSEAADAYVAAENEWEAPRSL